jgi:protein-disulfide isomerase
VQQDLEEGTRAGVSGTPSVFVNGRALTTGGSLEAITGAIEEELTLLAKAKGAES